MGKLVSIRKNYETIDGGSNPAVPIAIMAVTVVDVAVSIHDIGL